MNLKKRVCLENNKGRHMETCRPEETHQGKLQNFLIQARFVAIKCNGR